MFMHPRGWRQMTMAAAVLLLPAGEVVAQSKTMTITATEPMTTDNPYGDSSAPVYSLWCHTYGCLGRYDIARNKPIGILAEKWEAIDTTTWRFTLRKGLKRQDGGPGPTSGDVIHSLNRIRTDPESVQSSFVAMIDKIVAVDDLTFDIKTKAPAVNLVFAIFDRFTVTSAELYKQHGRDADKKFAFGWGPYKLEEYLADRRVVMRYGIVLTLTYNLPFERIDAADVRVWNAQGVGDISLQLNRADRIAWVHLWPHNRPWHMKHPQPSLRCVPQASEAGRVLAQAWSVLRDSPMTAPATDRTPAHHNAPGVQTQWA